MKNVWLAPLALICLTLPVSAAVTGVLGLSEVEVDAAIGIWFPLEPDQAVTAVRWHNNDGTTPIPELMLSAGIPENPGHLAGASAVGVSVFGGTDRLSRFVLAEPVGSAVDGLYVLFRLPQGSVPIHRGHGGGVALGYSEAPDGPLSWLTPDGEHWIPLSDEITLEVEIETTEAEDSTVRLERDAGKQLGLAASHSDVEIPVDAFLTPSPNPFNPKTTFRFSLAQAGPVLLEVYDLKGRKLASPVRGRYSAGTHQVDWTARDESGRDLASGVYLGRMKLGTIDETQRLVLVR